MSADTGTDAGLVISVTRGRPSPEETAAVVAVLLAARPAAPAGQERPAANGWTARSRVRTPLEHPAPQAWRASGWPGGSAHV